MRWEPAPSIAEQILEQGGDYALALKDNQADPCTEVKATFTLAQKDQSTPLHTLRTVNSGHGRLEIRTYETRSSATILQYLDPQQRWAGLQGIGKVTAERHLNQEVSRETRYFRFRFPDVETFAKAVRGHWGIENSLRLRAGSGLTFG